MELELERLRGAKGKIALIGEALGWHVQYLHWEPSTSESTPASQKWMPLSGIKTTKEEAVAEAIASLVGSS